MSHAARQISMPTSTATLLAVAAGRPLPPVAFIVVLGALTALGPFTMDLYLPAFPAVQEYFATSATMVQLTLTATALGLGVGQFIVGPVTDAVGRRVPLISATSLHVTSSVIIAVAPTIEIVALARFGQGVGAAAGAVVASAMIRDLFGGKRLVKMAARIALVNGAAPILAPLLGSQLLLITEWRGVFWVLALFGVVVLAAVAILIPETLPPARRSAQQRSWTDRVRVLLGDRIYVGAVLTGAMVFAVIVSYLAASPFIFQDDYGLSEQAFGFVFAVNAIGLLLATQLSARLMRRFRPATLLLYAMPAMIVSGAAFIAAGAVDADWWWVMAASCLLVSLHGFTGPCLHILILANHPDESGTAVAMSGFVQSIVGGLLSLLPALLGGVSAASLGLLVVGAAAAGLVALTLIVQPSRVPALAME